MIEPYYDDGQITIYHGDCRDVLPTLDWCNGDVVISDPPYGTGGWRRDAAGQGRNPGGTLVREMWDAGDTEWLHMVDADAVLTFWPAARTLPLLTEADLAGFPKHRALYMKKLDPKPQVQGRVRWSVEPIWVLGKEGFQLYGDTDWYEASTPRLGRDSDATGHPYQKPLSVMTWLVGKTKATRIIDPFMGSGTTVLAAKNLNRRAIGIEISEEYCEIAVRRLQQSVLPLNV